jgi:hypothetical protein
MKTENDKLDSLFEKLENQWDIHDLQSQHEERFMGKLTTKKSLKKYILPITIAASVIILLGVSLFYNPNTKSNELKFASKETKQTDSIFNVLIEKQLEKIKDRKSPVNEKIITDALKQMKTLDSDYEKIKLELEKNGESKQIIYALISNLQTRISFLQNVLKCIDNNEKLNTISDEKTI